MGPLMRRHDGIVTLARTFLAGVLNRSGAAGVMIEGLFRTPYGAMLRPGKSCRLPCPRQLRGRLGHVNKRLRNLLAAIADGLVKESGLFREEMAAAEAERENLVRLIEAEEARACAALKPIGLDEAAIAAQRLRRLILEAPGALKKRYVRAFVSEIVVGRSEIVVADPQDALAEAVSGETIAHIAGGPVRSLVLANGAPERIRTSDPQIRSLVLYPAELRARIAQGRPPEGRAPRGPALKRIARRIARPAGTGAGGPFRVPRPSRPARPAVRPRRRRGRRRAPGNRRPEARRA